MKNLSELVNAKVVSEESAEAIRIYYANQNKGSSNKLLVAFGILGAVLVGLGIILLLAHNWDELPRAIKVILAFLPLAMGQLVCGYTLLKKPDSFALRESGTAFLMLAIGSSISLIGQIYNIPGSVDSFLLTWMLLSLPLVYIMKSSVGSLLYLIGITTYAVITGFDYRLEAVFNWDWILLLGIVPHYVMLHKHKANSSATNFHNWLFPIAIIIMLGTLISEYGELLAPIYLGLFGLFYLVGHFEFMSKGRLRNNGFKILGSLGQLFFLLSMSFGDFSRHSMRFYTDWSRVFGGWDALIFALIIIAAISVFVVQRKGKTIASVNPLKLTFLLAIAFFFLGYVTAFSVLFINLLIVAIGILTIRMGAKQDHLGVLNYGLLIISALIICRFFDTDISFIVKGILFVALGISFFYTNYLIIKKRNKDVKK